MKTRRRGFFLSVCGLLAGVFGIKAVAESRSETPLYGQFDAVVWAREFCRLNPGADEATMIGWFANAIMTGYDEAHRRAAPKTASEWRASEALYAFAGWLTTRPEPITMSAVHDAAPASEAVAEFCKRHDLAEPRANWSLAMTT